MADLNIFDDESQYPRIRAASSDVDHEETSEVVASMSQYPRIRAASSDPAEPVPVTPRPRVSIPSHSGSLFGQPNRSAPLQSHLCAIGGLEMRIWLHWLGVPRHSRTTVNHLRGKRRWVP